MEEYCSTALCRWFYTVHRRYSDHVRVHVGTHSQGPLQSHVSEIVCDILEQIPAFILLVGNGIYCSQVGDGSHYYLFAGFLPLSNYSFLCLLDCIYDSAFQHESLRIHAAE